MPGPINHRHPLMQQPPQHVKNGMLTLWRLLPYWGGQWHYLVAVFLCSAISVLVSIVSPVIIGKVASTDAWRLALLPFRPSSSNILRRLRPFMSSGY